MTTNRWTVMGGYVAGFALLFAIWHLAATTVARSALFPPPWPVLERGWVLIEDGILQEQVVASLRRWPSAPSGRSAGCWNPGRSSSASSPRSR